MKVIKEGYVRPKNRITCKTHYKVGDRNYTRDIIPFSKRFVGENYEK